MLDFFTKSLSELDPAVSELIGYEAERQARKLILIPSESQAPEAVRTALGSVFQNIYAEGYPNPDTHRLTEAEILDYGVQLAHYRRFSDARYYKGVEYANIVEALARRRAAEIFAANGIAADDIYTNVQPLSGSPANSAVYAALVPAGATVMGMDLLHGGHLTHGSPANRSGKLYRIVSYGIDPDTERLNYDEIERLARAERPKMIIAGYTSYPWMPDWARFRQIADAVGAYLLADISHIAGMVAAGVVASPVGYAHVISFTTHKTLYGPRGACILTTDEALAAKIDSAVFPGEQGGPHVNAMAGMAVSFRLAGTPEFRQLQQQVVDNAVTLAAELQARGLRIPYGGTNTHMLLVDCKSVRAASGASPDKKKGTPLMGDTAARILDLAGVVCNRNTIPGDKSARTPSGIRLGTPWVTQRGFRAAEIGRMAEIIARVLQGCQPYATAGRSGPLYSAHIDFDLLEEAKRDVVDLACCVDLGPDYTPSGYPHHYFMYKPTTDPGGEWDIVEIEGAFARDFCNVVLTNDVYALGPGESQPTWVLEPDGRPMSAGLLRRPGPETTRLQLMVAKESESRVAHWLRAVSDGFVLLDKDDVYVTAPGPVVIRRLPHTEVEEWDARPPALEQFADGKAGWAYHKPYWIGHAGSPRPAADELGSLSAFEWQPPVDPPLKRTTLYDAHKQLRAKLVPFAGYEMPVQYTSVMDEHLAVRNRAGLFDVSHMGLFEFSGENAHLLLQTLTTNDVSPIAISDSQYSFLLAPDGSVIDDVWVYRLDTDRYWMVVNAANNDKDWAWINAVLEGRVQIDAAQPWVRALGAPTAQVRDMRAAAQGAEARVQLALQGPRSRDILLALLAPGDPLRETLREMKRNQIIHGRFGEFDLSVSRTGYTGEPMAFEIFAHPDAIPALWDALLAAGKPFGVQPCGLAARDSLRIEAGLPLYGHELAGPLNLDPSDAGFASFIKVAKPYFIGKAAYLAREAARSAQLVRFQLDEERAPLLNQGDVIVNRKGRVAGWVTSCSINSEGRLVGLGYVQTPYNERDTRLAVYRTSAKTWGTGALESLTIGDRIQLPEHVTVIQRFLNKK
ncbi:MAG: Serine hydroxymethyltransferase [Chloroflexi bacterium ADurb.Bin325]|nr:MAG: Serine hydroxymethyltransferase [Chloroflexi bacterium ADurb.Bin325]